MIRSDLGLTVGEGWCAALLQNMQILLLQGLVATSHSQITQILLSAATSLAHVTAAQGSASSPVNVGFHGSNSAKIGRVEAACKWPNIGGESLQYPSPTAIR